MNELPDPDNIINLLRELGINPTFRPCNCPRCQLAKKVDMSKVKVLYGPYECPICFETVAGIYKMNCDHKICINCAEKWKKECVEKGNLVSCPLCRREDVLFGTRGRSSKMSNKKSSKMSNKKSSKMSNKKSSKMSNKKSSKMSNKKSSKMSNKKSSKRSNKRSCKK